MRCRERSERGAFGDVVADMEKIRDGVCAVGHEEETRAELSGAKVPCVSRMQERSNPTQIQRWERTKMELQATVKQMSNQSPYPKRVLDHPSFPGYHASNQPNHVKCSVVIGHLRQFPPLPFAVHLDILSSAIRRKRISREYACIHLHIQS